MNGFEDRDTDAFDPQVEVVNLQELTTSFSSSVIYSLLDSRTRTKGELFRHQFIGLLFDSSTFTSRRRI